MKINILSTIMVLMCFVSCSTYVNTSVSLSQAVGKGKVKTSSNLGKITYFKSIEFEDSTYFGVKGKSRVIINDIAVPKVYLSALYKSNNYRIWVKSIGSNQHTQGYLYAVQDSSLLISQNLPSAGFDELINVSEIEASIIETIRIREKGKVGRGYLKGTFIAMGIGAAAGLVLGVQAEEGTGFALAVMGIGAGLIGPIGSLIGLAVGSKSDIYRINGKQNTFNNYKAFLKERSLRQID